MYKPFNLEKLSDLDIRFYNTFIGETRFLELPISEHKYFLTLHDEVKNLKHKVVFKIDVAGQEFYFFVKNYPIVENFDKNFKDIDLILLPEVVRAEVAKTAFETIMKQLTTFFKLDFELQDIYFDNKVKYDFEKTVGLTVFDDNKQSIVVGNLNLSVDLLSMMLGSLEKIPAEKVVNDLDVKFSMFLEAGRTMLSKQEYETLEENDIIFIDDDSHVRSMVFDLRGIEPIKASGSFNKNGEFELKNVIR